MKKLLIGICTTLGVTLIGFGIYISLPSTTPANTSHAYEYYYTKDTVDKQEEPKDIVLPEPVQPEDEPAETLHPQTPDTEASSITVLVNHMYTLPADYIPENLVVPDVYFNFSYMAEKKLMRADAAEALEEMFRAAKDENISLCAISGYRSYVRQNRIYLSNVRNSGEDYANRYSAPPGHSEHQTGLTMDVSSASNHYNLSYELADLPEGQWLKENAHRFGFIIRYPEDKEDITGYAYEPWHVRYVGTELASYLYEQGISLDEYYGYTAVGHDWTFDFDAAYKLLAATTPLATPEEEEAEKPEDAEDGENDEDSNEGEPSDGIDGSEDGEISDEDDESTDPELPLIPLEPAVPDEPADPSDPTYPDDPTDPSDPTYPGEPTDPSDPTYPGEPADPSDPTYPGEPADPSDPTYPDEPTDPSDPTYPGEPTDPSDPTYPGEPADPSDPTYPDEPTFPEDPEFPVNTEYPEYPSENINTEVTFP